MKPLLHYYNIGTGVVAFSTTRHGGVSKGNYSDFNINRYCGDSLKAIGINNKAFADELNISTERIIMPHQVHGTDACRIDNDFFKLDDESRKNVLEGKDALYTNIDNVCIGVSTADCIPVLLYDPASHVAAAIHAGWRGTVKRIVKRTVETIAATMGVAPSDLIAVIGPGISLKNFEIGDEVYDEFNHEDFDMSLIAKRYPDHTDPNKEKWHIDLPLCNKLQLLAVGVKEENILMSGICTFDSVNDYFSARRLGQNSGRIFTGIMME